MQPDRRAADPETQDFRVAGGERAGCQPGAGLVEGERAGRFDQAGHVQAEQRGQQAADFAGRGRRTAAAEPEDDREKEGSRLPRRPPEDGGYREREGREGCLKHDYDWRLSPAYAAIGVNYFGSAATAWCRESGLYRVRVAGAASG